MILEKEKEIPLIYNKQRYYVRQTSHPFFILRDYYNEGFLSLLAGLLLFFNGFPYEGKSNLRRFAESGLLGSFLAFCQLAALRGNRGLHPLIIAIVEEVWDELDNIDRGKMRKHGLGDQEIPDLDEDRGTEAGLLSYACDSHARDKVTILETQKKETVCCEKIDGQKCGKDAAYVVVSRKPSIRQIMLFTETVLEIGYADLRNPYLEASKTIHSELHPERHGISYCRYPLRQYKTLLVNLCNLNLRIYIKTIEETTCTIENRLKRRIYQDYLIQAGLRRKDVPAM